MQFSRKQCCTAGAVGTLRRPAQLTPKVTHMDRAVEVSGCIRVFIYLGFKWMWARATTKSEILMCCNHQRSLWSQCCKDATCVGKSYTWQCLQIWDAVLCASAPVCASYTKYTLLFCYLPFLSFFLPPMKWCSWDDAQFTLLYSQGFSAVLRKSCNLY